MRQKLSWTLGLALVAMALAVPVRAEEATAAPSDGYAKVSAAVDELSAVWDTWELIPDFKPEAYGPGPDGKPVQVGANTGRHTETEKYGHVDVALMHAFGGTELAYIQIECVYFRAVAIREENGKLTVVATGKMSVKVNAKGEAESFTVDFTRGDGSAGSRTFTRPKTKTKT